MEENVYEKKELVVDVLTKMLLEQSNLARHQEIQRSTVTTIFTSLEVALVGLMGVLLNQGEGRLNGSFLPITIALVLLGLIGLVLTTKLFERSMVHFTLFEAYLNTINSIMKDETAKLFPGREVEKILYVTNAREYVKDKQTKQRAHEITFPKGKRVVEQLDAVKMLARIEQHIPIDPREIVIPIHNEVARYPKNFPFWEGIRFSKLDLWGLWAGVYGLFILAGGLLTGYILIDLWGVRVIIFVLLILAGVFLVGYDLLRFAREND